MNKRPPKTYFEMFHHAVGLDESLLELVIGKYGTDKFLVGTDYPHPDAHMNVAQTVQTLSTISREAYEAISWRNAARLFSLEAVGEGSPRRAMRPGTAATPMRRPAGEDIATSRSSRARRSSISARVRFKAAASSPPDATGRGHLAIPLRRGEHAQGALERLQVPA